MNEPLTLHMPPPRKPRRLKISTLLTLSLVALLLMLSGTLFWFSSGKLPVPQGMMEGTRMPIAAPLTAQVSEVLVKDGQSVHAGQPLARLENAAYRRQETDARALLRHAMPHMPGMEETAQRVADAQEAEEYTVRRVALARHEEDAARQLLERRVMEHVQAELRLRNLDARSGGHAPGSSRNAAVRDEAKSRQNRDSAKAGYEAASRARAAVEGELRRVRQEVDRARAARRQTPQRVEGQGQWAQQAAPIADPTVLSAPADGRIAGSLTPGQQVQRGEALLHLVPSAQHELWATAAVSPQQAAALRLGQFCRLRPAGFADTVLHGEVQEVAPVPADADDISTAVVPIRIRLLLPAPPLSPLAPEIMAALPGRTAQITVWTHDIPGLRAYTPLLSRFF